MPFHLDPLRQAKIHFVTSPRMPSLIFKAATLTGKCSNTVYIQHALCEILARDLDMDLDELLAELPVPKTNAKTLKDWSREHHSAKARESR
jgi:hypothetical protein